MKKLFLLFLLVGCSNGADLSKAKEIYDRECSSCHGINGRGDGPAASAFVPPPRNYTLPNSEWKNGKSVEGITKTLNEGILPNMWAYSGPKENIPLLAEYILHLGK